MKKLITLAACTMLVAAPAFANKDRSDMRDGKSDYFFNKVDTNKDGRISKAEHDRFSQKMFDEADTDNNNSVSRNEMMAQKRREKEEMHSSLGYDRDYDRDYDRYSDRRDYRDRMAPSAGNPADAPAVSGSPRTANDKNKSAY